MSLGEKLDRLEKSLRLLQDEIQQAKKEARGLEAENQRLRSLLYETVGTGDQQAVAGESGLSMHGTAYGTLGTLHAEGFHVCHHLFGRERDGGCLFCHGFLEKGKEKHSG